MPQVLPWQKPLAYGLAFVLAAETIYLLVTRARPEGNILPPDATVNTVENLRQVGMTLFSDYLLPFEVTSILLLVAMVGAITISRREKGRQK